MVGACIVIFCLAVLYEGLKVLREYLLKRALVSGSKYQEVTIGTKGLSSVSDPQVKSRYCQSGKIIKLIILGIDANNL